MQDFYVGFPTLSRYDLLQQAVDGVNRSRIKPKAIFILDNGKRCPDIKSDIKTHIIHTPFNFGISGSWNSLWNLAEDSNLFLLNDDMQVGESSFEIMLETDADIVLGYGYSLFMVTPQLRKKVGDFDERFWPMYWEDVDYHVRVERTDTKVATPTIPDFKHLDGGSATFHDNPWMKPFLEENKQKMFRKWGMNDAEEAKMRKNEPFYTSPEPNIIDPIEEYLRYGRHLPKTRDFGEVVLKWMGF